MLLSDVLSRAQGLCAGKGARAGMMCARLDGLGCTGQRQEAARQTMRLRASTRRGRGRGSMGRQALRIASPASDYLRGASDYLPPVASDYLAATLRITSKLRITFAHASNRLPTGGAIVPFSS